MDMGRQTWRAWAKNVTLTPDTAGASRYKMPLTRNLYELDEVISALQLCLREDNEQALFWLWELVVSGEEAAALSAVIEEGAVQSQPTDWVRVYVSIRQTKATVANLLARCKSPTQKMDTVTGLKDACRRKNMIAATWFVREATCDVWSILTEIDPTITIKQPDLRHQVEAVIQICGRRPPLVTAPDQARWDSWTTAIGRRKARIYAIPTQALHEGTTRGQLPTKYTNIADIREPVSLLSEGCKFWQETLLSMGIDTDEDGNVCFPDDDVLERFYTRYFPDDIPDEWSAEDQQKSHGRGIGHKKLTVLQAV